MSRFHFAVDAVSTAAEARAAAIAAEAWRRSIWGTPTPPERPEPAFRPWQAPCASNAAGKPAVRVDFGRTRVRDVIAIAAATFGVSIDDLLGRDRRQCLIVPRHAAIAVAYKLTGQSLPQIGKAFGGRDHTSVLHAVRKFEAQQHPELQVAVADLMAAIESAASSGNGGAADGQ